MARGVNKAIILGHLGDDPDTRYAQSGSAVTNFSVATSFAWRDKQSNEMKEETTWHRVVMFGKLGEIAEKYLKKGSKVYLEGRLQTRKWQDKQGQDRWTTEVIAEHMQMLDSKQSGSQPANQAPDFDAKIPF